MAQYAELLNQALAWAENHETLLAVAGGLLATQGGVWWLLHRAINRIKGRPVDAPPTERELAAKEAIENVVRFAPHARSMLHNVIVRRVLERLRAALEIGPDAIADIQRHQRRLASQGLRPPETVAECDEMLDRTEPREPT